MLLLEIPGFLSQKVIPNYYKIWGSISKSAEARATFALNERLWFCVFVLPWDIIGVIESEQGRNTTP